MKLILLTIVTMIAFAANSVLTRMGVDQAGIDPSGFALIRVLSGAGILAVIVLLRGQRIPIFRQERLLGAASLAGYMVGFSLAYQTLDAGLGALILFGVVQIVMFAAAAAMGDRPTGRQMSGASIAFGGLVLVLAPNGETQVSVWGAGLMIVAGIGWAAYTIAGRGARDPLASTAANFILCVPLIAVFAYLHGLQMSFWGGALATISGAITSGLGYALWYLVLPQLRQTTAAAVQLSVPVIALGAGALLLSEPVSLALVFAAMLVLGGIALAISPRSVPADHS